MKSVKREKERMNGKDGLEEWLELRIQLRISSRRNLRKRKRTKSGGERIENEG